MPFTMTLPQHYGLVVLGGGVLPFVTNIILAGPVMSARKKYNVPYPNAYAVPGFHDQECECLHRSLQPRPPRACRATAARSCRATAARFVEHAPLPAGGRV